MLLILALEFIHEISKCCAYKFCLPSCLPRRPTVFVEALRKRYFFNFFVCFLKCFYLLKGKYRLTETIWTDFIADEAQLLEF